MSTVGPEDSARWSHPSNSSKKDPVQACHTCKNTIVLWHCAESGCAWCAECGTKASNKGDV